MRTFFLLSLFFLSLGVGAQQSGTLYVAAKTGLSVREKPETGSQVLDKIPYGTKVTLLQSEEEPKSILTEGITGYWKKVKFNNKTGYIIDSYLFPWPPPKLPTVKEMKAYLAQVTVPFGAKLIVKSGTMTNIADGGWELHKQLYKNGAERHEHYGYEYGSDTYILPGFSMQQGFLLVRLIAEFKDVFTEKDVFPFENKTFKKGENDYIIKVDKEVYSEEYTWFRRISVEFADGASYSFEMYMLDNQLVISYGSGV